jgi:hypothetical protein
MPKRKQISAKGSGLIDSVKKGLYTADAFLRKHKPVSKLLHYVPAIRGIEAYKIGKIASLAEAAGYRRKKMMGK